MKNSLTIFNNPEFGQVRTLSINDEPWFVGKDIAEALGYAKPENALAAHVEDADKTTTLIQGDGSNYKSKTTIINESGLYALIFGSKLPTAKAFKHWVTSEVLPAIRKTGVYKADASKQSIAEAKLLNARARVAAMWTKLADRVDVPEYKQICASYASTTLAGHEVLPLPQSEQHYYSATEIGKMLGINKTRVGSIANAHNMKTETFGKWFHDKSPYSCKEVDTFKYNDAAVKHFRELLARVEDEVS